MSINLQTKFDTDNQNIFFTSDTHFFHGNIIRFCNRPWKNADEMNKGLIKNWNNTVAPNDVVFHLGDVFLGAGSKDMKNVLEQLNGKIYLILGNHDRWEQLEKTGRFEWVMPKMLVTVNKRPIILNHEPLDCWGGCYREPDRCTWNLFGHIHSTNNNSTGLDVKRNIDHGMPSQYDVGVDKNDYKPVSFDDVNFIIYNQITSLNLYKA